MEYAEFDGRLWGRCRWVPGRPYHMAAAHRQRARVTVLGSTVETWSASAPACLCRIFLLFYAKENSDPEVVGLALWRGLRITLNGEVCTVDTSVVFRACCCTWNLDLTLRASCIWQFLGAMLGSTVGTCYASAPGFWTVFLLKADSYPEVDSRPALLGPRSLQKCAQFRFWYTWKDIISTSFAYLEALIVSVLLQKSFSCV